MLNRITFLFFSSKLKYLKSLFPITPIFLVPSTMPDNISWVDRQMDKLGS